jgi:hypothetical protein
MLGVEAVEKGSTHPAREFKRDMSADLPNSDVDDQLHYDLLVKRLTDSDSTEFPNDLEK